MRPKLNSHKTVRAAMNAYDRASSDPGSGSAIPLRSLPGPGVAHSNMRFGVEAETKVSDDTGTAVSEPRSEDRKV
jgi:hypothetical protein